LGITAVELAERGPPLQDMHPMRALLKLGGDYQPELKEPELYSKDFVDFVNLALRKDPSKRPTASELLKHPFIVNGKYDMDGFKKLQQRANKMKEEDLAQEGEDEEYDSSEDEDEKKSDSSSSNKKLQNSSGSVNSDSPKVENKRESKNEKLKEKPLQSSDSSGGTAEEVFSPYRRMRPPTQALQKQEVKLIEKKESSSSKLQTKQRLNQQRLVQRQLERLSKLKSTLQKEKQQFEKNYSKEREKLVSKLQQALREHREQLQNRKVQIEKKKIM